MKNIKKLIPLLIALFFMVGCMNNVTHGRIIDATPIPKEPEKLTLMIYMAADNDLESYALENLKSMERSVYNGTKVIVLLDRSEGYDETDGNWTETRLYEVLHDDSNKNNIVSKRLSSFQLGLSADTETELDMANYNVLRKFIDFCKEEYEAEKYALIIWGHGTGWRYSYEGNLTPSRDFRAVAIDDHTGSYMSVHDLGVALKNEGLSVIGFDTCFGGVIENVYEIRNTAQYIVASPGVTPSIGWNYQELLENLDYTDVDIAKAMKSCSRVQTTIFKNSKIEDLQISFESFSKALSQSISNDTERKELLDSLFTSKSYSYTTYPCDMYLDIYSMADLFINCENDTLKAAASNLQKQLIAATADDSFGVGVHLIPMQNKNTMANAHSEDYIKDSNNVEQFAFVKESLWWAPTRNGDSESLLDKLFYYKK